MKLEPMKVSAHEARRAHRTAKRTRNEVVITRKAVIRAFSAPGMSRQVAMEIVRTYMGSSPVPPAWGRLGVRGTFGGKIERRWSRFIRRLRPAGYEDTQRHWLQPFVQTPHDFGIDPEQRGAAPSVKELRTARHAGR
ncbi:hypothetical protein [Paraburkholderia flagellata]|uniref:hypothetical protein n=1 Tax=Paraburkholderia flagellata TaxID=2883241 RepID=UPI001F1A0B2C|nr:hypothetical protein [Paraburkholderia flagellata]